MNPAYVLQPDTVATAATATAAAPAFNLPFSAGLMGAGMVFNLFAQYGANLSQAMYEAENARMYRQQVDLAIAATQRELAIAGRNYAYQSGSTVSGYAAQGLDVGTGSPADMIGSIAARKIEELDAIRRQGELNIKLASSREMRAQAKSDTLRSNGFNIAQATGTVLTGMTEYERAHPGAFDYTFKFGG